MPTTIMLSMTGFGSGVVETSSNHITVSIQTLNHRFMDIRLRIPRAVTVFSGEIEKLVRESVQRGHVEVSVTLQSSAEEAPSVNWELARSFLKDLRTLKNEFEPEGPLPFELLGSLPSFVASERTDQHSLKENVLNALKEALTQHTEMRKSEGQGVLKHLTALAKNATTITQRVAGQTDSLVQAQQERARERIREIASERALDEARLEQEIAIIASRMDVAEEIQRLQSHITQFEKALSTPPPTGRKLDFILQEMGRETNTLSTKLRLSKLQDDLLELKTTVERMREQVQNVL